MKKIVVFMAFAAFLFAGFQGSAQNKFKGIIKYTATATGPDAMEVVKQYPSAEMRVMGEQVYVGGFGSILFTFNGMTNCIVQNGRTITTANDLSQYMLYLSTKDIALTSYQGDGKILLRQTITQQEIDSLTIPCTEGYYIEYIDQTRKIAGVDAKLARIHMFDGEGVDHPTDVWYSPDMGPEANFLCNGIHGVPMEFTRQLDENNSITLTVSEVVKGKVKDVDFFMPDGYKPMTDEEFTEFIEEFSEEIKALQEED